MNRNNTLGELADRCDVFRCILCCGQPGFDRKSKHLVSCCRIALSFWLTVLLLTGFPLFAADQSAASTTADTLPKKPSGEPETVHVLAFADLHGHVDSKSLYPRRKPYGLRYIASLAARLRKRYPELIVVNAGDFLSGSELSRYLMEAGIPEENNPIRLLLQQLPRTVHTPGNHDLEFYSGQRDFLTNPQISVTAVNLLDRDQPTAYSKPVIITVGHTQLVFIGVTGSGSLFWNDPQENARYRILPTKQAVDTALAALPPHSRRIIIGILHTGLNPYRDFETAVLYGAEPFNNAAALIKAVPRFDLVIAGHDHNLSPSKNTKPVIRINGTPAVEPGYWGKSALLITLKASIGKRKNVLQDVTVIRSDDFPAPAKFPREFDRNAYQRFLEADTGYRLVSKEDPATCLNRLLSLAVQETGTEITALPPLKLKPFFLRKNQTVRRKHLLFWLPYTNRPVTVNLSRHDLEVLTQRITSGQKNLPYNRNLLVYPADYSKNLGDAEHTNRFRRSIPVIFTNYHANGGGGIRGELFFDESNIALRRHAAFDRLFFDYLVSHNPPGYCSMFAKS